jgi:acylphosphatase
MKEEMHIIISGRVQGVFFRDYARRKAEKLGIKGRVRNLDDGTVEIVAQGEEASLLRFLEEIKRGSLPSKVERVNVERREPKEVFESFEMILR